MIDATARELEGLPEEGGTARLGWLPIASTIVDLALLAATPPFRPFDTEMGVWAGLDERPLHSYRFFLVNQARPGRPTNSSAAACTPP